MDNITKNKVQIISLGFCLFVLIIVFIANLSSLRQSNPKAELLNYDTVVETLSAKNIRNLEDSFAVFATNFYPEAAAAHKFTITVRPETLKTYYSNTGEEASFMIDVPEIRMTYNVRMSLMDEAIAIFTCPSQELIKYEGATCKDRQEQELSED